MNRKGLIILVLALVLPVAVFFLYGRGNKLPARISNPQLFETITDERGEISVSVTPLNDLNKMREWRFKVVMDTHSVELNHNLAVISVLISDNGREYKPARWEGSTGGHHREGMLVFENVGPLSESFKLIITDLGGFTRIFTWQLK